MTTPSPDRLRLALLLPLVAVLLLVGSPAQANDDAVALTVEAVVRLEDLGADFDVPAAVYDAEVVEALVPSRGLLVVSRTVEVVVDADELDEARTRAAHRLAGELAGHPLVAWTMPRGDLDVRDSRAHAWPDGLPVPTRGPDDAVMDYLDVDLVHTAASGDGVVVAVLDTGVDMDHRLLRGRLLRGWDLVDDDRDASEVTDGVDGDADGLVDEAHGHGTFVAGVVAQVAPAAAVLPIRVLDADGRGEPAVMVEGIHLAVEAGADVVNISSSLLDEHEPDALRDAVVAARRAGVQVVAASGNRASNHRVYPAASSGVLAVSAMDIEDESQVANFSSYGSWVDVAAPGVDVVSAAPGGGLVRWSGTSTAAPVVAAQVALLRSFDPTASPRRVHFAIGDTARPMRGRRHVSHGTVDLVASLKHLDAR